MMTRMVGVVVVFAALVILNVYQAATISSHGEAFDNLGSRVALLEDQVRDLYGQSHKHKTLAAPKPEIQIEALTKEILDKLQHPEPEGLNLE